MGAWDYSEMVCSKACGGGHGNRTRPVKRPAQHGGKPCPVLWETVPCNTQSCRATVVKNEAQHREAWRRKQGTVVSWPMPRKDLAKAGDGDIHTWYHT